MKLHEVIHATTRYGWTARLIAYVALIVTLSLLVQVVQVFWL